MQQAGERNCVVDVVQVFDGEIERSMKALNWRKKHISFKGKTIMRYNERKRLT